MVFEFNHKAELVKESKNRNLKILFSKEELRNTDSGGLAPDHTMVESLVPHVS